MCRRAESCGLLGLRAAPQMHVPALRRSSKTGMVVFGILPRRVSHLSNLNAVVSDDRTMSVARARARIRLPWSLVAAFACLSSSESVFFTLSMSAWSCCLFPCRSASARRRSTSPSRSSTARTELPRQSLRRLSVTLGLDDLQAIYDLREPPARHDRLSLTVDLPTRYAYMVDRVFNDPHTQQRSDGCLNPVRFVARAASASMKLRARSPSVKRHLATPAVSSRAGRPSANPSMSPRGDPGDTT